MNRRSVLKRLSRAPLALGLVGLLSWPTAGLAAEKQKPTATGTASAQPAGAQSSGARTGRRGCHGRRVQRGRARRDDQASQAPQRERAVEPDAAKPDAAKQAAAKEEAAAFKAARPELQRQMRSKTVATRVEGVRRLEGFPQVEAAKLAINAGMSDEAEEVRAAAYEVMLRFSSNVPICRYLLGELRRQASSGESGENSLTLLLVLSASSIPEVDASTLHFLDSVLHKSKNGGLRLAEWADLLGTRDAEDSVALLAKLSKTRLFAERFLVRRSVIGALVQLDRLSAMGELIRILGDVQGEARGEILRYLTSLTGDSLMGDTKAWAVWWRQNKDKFVLPPPGARGGVAIAAADTPSYYGLPIYAEKMVFVIDTSSSMRGARLDAAKRELTDAIGNLREETQFAIVVFNGGVDVLQRKLMPANKGNKLAAINYVQSQAARSNTASFDALETAFMFDAEAIFFLSDGQPNAGKVPRPIDILNVITQLNRSRRESIYTIGIAPGPVDSPMEWFMKTLAQQNLGLYRRVDE